MSTYNIPFGNLYSPSHTKNQYVTSWYLSLPSKSKVIDPSICWASQNWQVCSSNRWKCHCQLGDLAGGVFGGVPFHGDVVDAVNLPEEWVNWCNLWVSSQFINRYYTSIYIQCWDVFSCGNSSVVCECCLSRVYSPCGRRVGFSTMMFQKTTSKHPKIWSESGSQFFQFWGSPVLFWNKEPLKAFFGTVTSTIPIMNVTFCGIWISSVPLFVSVFHLLHLKPWNIWGSISIRCPWHPRVN